MAVSSWAPAVGAVLGGVIGASGTLAVQSRLWRHEGRTRWDERTLLAYAVFLQTASRAFSCALARLTSAASAEPDRFSSTYEEAAASYEELILLDPQVRPASRLLLCIVWSTAQGVAPAGMDDLESVAYASYRDARFHVRERAQARLGVLVDARAAPVDQDCQARLHELEWPDSV